MIDEIEEYRKRIERRYGERRLKNERRRFRRKELKFWDLGTIINAIILAVIAGWFYFVTKFSGGTNG